MTKRILVWDMPTRIFHWALVLSFTGAFLTSGSERCCDIHMLFGYTMMGLIAFRLIWGLMGTRYARFANFVRSPISVFRYLAQMLKGHPSHPVGHNPAGAVAIISILLFGAAACTSGWAAFEDIGGDWLEQFHEFSSYAMLAVVVAHIAGVLISSCLQKENLIFSMITGRKHGTDTQAISGNHPLIGILLLTILIGFWLSAWPASKDERWFREIGHEISEVWDLKINT